MENTGTSKETAEDLFFKFMDAEDCPEITHTFRRLVKLLGIKVENPREFYSSLKGKLQSWRCKSLWELLDCRANQKEYSKGNICEDIQVLVIGAGPIGLRTAIEVALLGAQVVIVEKRESFVRNNVLHLWPFLLTDFRSLGAKKLYGKFCSGSIDHISIRRLQAILLKAALIFGAKLYTGVTFEHVIEPNSVEDGWKCKVSPDTHPVSTYEFDVLIGADGKKNVIPGFQQIEMRGTLAIGITANFVNHGTEEEANVEEISGIAYQFNPQFFDVLHAQKGIKLENIVYYKDETHYFVMTAGKASLLKRGALKEDLGQPAKLLAPCNIDHSKLLEYVTDVVKYATKGTLKNLELKIVGNNQPDIAAFDFTSIKKAEHAARIIERKGSKLLVGLVGDSLLEPFWPTGSGCARGVLSALDAAWMIPSLAQDKPPLQILSERENIYRLLSGTSAENLHKDHAKYTINPSSRYLQITHKRIREVYHLYDTDDAVNADFSIGSPQTAVNNKAARRRRISTGAKFTSSKGRKRGRATEFDIGRIRSTSGSSTENLGPHKPLSSAHSAPLDGRRRAHTMLSSAESEDDVFEKKPRRVRIDPKASPVIARGRRSTIGSSGDELKGKRKKSARKTTLSKENLEKPKDDIIRKKRGFFGFGKSKPKPKRNVNEDSDHYSDKECKLINVKQREENEKAGKRSEFVREDSWKRRPGAGSFSREQYTRRSARDIIREMEARSKGEAIGNGVSNKEKATGKGLDSKIGEKEGSMKRKKSTDDREVEEKQKVKKEDEKKKNREEEKKRKEEERKRKDDEKRRHEEERKRKDDEKRRHEEERKRKDDEKRRHEEEKKKKEEEEKARKKAEEEIKKREQANNVLNKKAQTTPTNKRSKKQALLDEIAKISPSARRAMPVLSKLSPELDKENDKAPEHSLTSAVREAAMLLMATPLLIDGLMPMKKLDRTGSWLARSSGRVRDVVQRYNTLNDMKPLINTANGDVTPLKRPRDSVDGPEEKPRRLNSDEVQDGNENYSENQNDSSDVKPTPPTQKRKNLQMKKNERYLSSSPSLERLKIKLQDYQGDAPRPDKDSPLPDVKPTIDFNSPIWQKTPIAAITGSKENSKAKEPAADSIDGKLTEETTSAPENEHVAVKESDSLIRQETAIAIARETESDENKENDKGALSSSICTNEKVTEKLLPTTKSSQRRRRSSVLPSDLMEEKLTNLLNNTTAQKAWESIKYMISLFKQIQKHPNEEKYYRIFKGRVKFRKHVWAVRNAKLFMTACGWTELGSFVIFPLSKQVEGPLLLLNKYLGIADEKRLQKQSEAGKESRPNLQRASSSDLAGKILELKQALVSSRSNSYKSRRSSGEMNAKSLFLRRTVSMDEVNEFRRTDEECTSPLRDSKHRINKLQKLLKPLAEEKHNKPESNLRRSVSENALYASPQDADEHTQPFSSIIRRFSQRGVTEKETACDLVMEDPINLETASSDTKHEHRSISSLADEEVATDVSKNDTLCARLYPDRHTVRSPREAVMEEVEQLSSVLGNMLDTLGSSSDSERESDSEKEEKKESENEKVTETIGDPYKDEELEALSETLNSIIQNNTCESSSESGNDNITTEKGYNLRKADVDHKNAFKPPIHPTRKTTEKLGKTKSLDSVEKPNQSSTTNGHLNRERVTKAKSVDVASLTSGRKPQESRPNTSKMVPKTATDRRESSVKTRAQRQRERNNSRLSEDTNRKQIVSNKQQSSTGARPPTGKRPAAKSRSVDMDRPRAQHAVEKSKSLDLQGNGIKATGRSQPKTRPGRSWSSEDEKKPPRTRNVERKRIPTVRQNSGNKKKRASLTKPKNQGRKSSTEENETSEELKISKSSKESYFENEQNIVNTEAAPETEKPTLSNQVFQEQNETSNYSADLAKISKAESFEENSPESSIWESEDVNQNNQTLLADLGNNDAILVEKHDEIVKLSKEIQSLYGISPPQPNGDVSECIDGENEVELPKVKQQLPSDSKLRALYQDSKQPLHVEEDKCVDDTDSRIKEDGNPNVAQHANADCSQSQPSDRKMTLMDIGKQQSRERLSRKEGVSLSLDERKQLVLEAAVSQPKSKPANKRRSILQIKKRNDGNLVKNKKETFEKPNVTHTASNGSEVKSPKRRHFRFYRRKKSFELSNEHLDIVPEDNEAELDENTNGIIPTKEAQDTRLHNGISAEPKTDGEKLENNVSKEKNRSPIKISPFQLRFTKRSGSYDLEKRASTGSVGSLEQCLGDCE